MATDNTNVSAKVVLTDNIFPDLALERQMFEKNNVELVEPILPGSLEDLLPDADAVINTYAKLTADLIKKMERCKLIIRNGIGVDTIDLKAASEKGIMVANIPTYCIDEVATHALSLILDCNRKVSYLNNAVKSGKWDVKLAIPIFSLEGKVLGLMGFGKIAQLINKRVKPFGMKVMAHDPYLTTSAAAQHGVELVDFKTLLKESDFISIHCPLTPETKGLFDYAVFRQMKNTAYVINTARGGIINQDDLLLALKEKEIAGAGLDVLDADGIDPHNPLLAMDNVIITPHAGWYSEESIIRRRVQTVENVLKVLKGGTPDSFVNKDALIKFSSNH